MRADHCAGSPGCHVFRIHFWNFLCDALRLLSEMFLDERFMQIYGVSCDKVTFVSMTFKLKWPGKDLNVIFFGAKLGDDTFRRGFLLNTISYFIIFINKIAL